MGNVPGKTTAFPRSCYGSRIAHCLVIIWKRYGGLSPRIPDLDLAGGECSPSIRIFKSLESLRVATLESSGGQGKAAHPPTPATLTLGQLPSEYSCCIPGQWIFMKHFLMESHYVAQLASHLWSSCLSLLRARTTGICPPYPADILWNLVAGFDIRIGLNNIK